MVKCYQYPVPSVLTDNSGIEFKAFDSSMTDVCEKCADERPADVIATLRKKAEGAVK
jgi:hypothetical protein